MLNFFKRRLGIYSHVNAKIRETVTKTPSRNRESENVFISLFFGHNALAIKTTICGRNNISS